jgi:hypothetical protein
MGILTPIKVTIRCEVVVPSSISDDNLSLVKHDARVDLNPGGVRIHYTQEPAFVSDSPPLSPPPYIVLGQQVGAGYGKMFIPNPDYKGKCHDTEGAATSSSTKDLRSTQNDEVH